MISAPAQIAQYLQRISRTTVLRWCFGMMGIAASFVVSTQTLSSQKNDSALVISKGQRPLLTYHHAIKYPPMGVDSLYQRSGFFHPVKTLRGHTITTIQPPDHYHHYGLWNAWTHVEYAGDTVDFWNLIKNEGTVRFKKFLSISEDQKHDQFIVGQEHVILNAQPERVALDEKLLVAVTPISKKRYAIDFHFVFQCAEPIPFKILEYRYAGFCWRPIESWNQGNSTVLTSTGLDRKEADGSRADWFMIQGQLGTDKGGAILMSHPDNYNHPQPLRIWPPKSGEQTQIMAMFAPTKFSDWIIQPGQKYALKYRMVVFDGRINGKQAQKSWRKYVKSIK